MTELTQTLAPLPDHDTAKKEWFRTLQLLDLHRRNSYLTFDDIGKRMGQSYGWAHLLFNPYHRKRAGRPLPTYPLPVVDAMCQSMGLELVSYPEYDLVRIPAELNRRRAGCKLSHAQVAQMLGVKPMTSYRWLTAKTPMPIIECIRLMAVFRMEPLTFLGEVATLPLIPTKKPRGRGQWAKQVRPTQVVERNGALVIDAPLPISPMTIAPDGTVSWSD